MILAQLRRGAGLSQAELGEQIGVTQQTVANWETGRAEPNIEMLKRLADMFGITVDNLIDDGPERRRTYADDFLERCPEAPTTGGLIKIPLVPCVRMIYGYSAAVCNIDMCCLQCWLRPYKDEKEEGVE